MERRDFIKKSCGICAVMGSGIALSAFLQACKTAGGIIKTTAQNNSIHIPLAEFSTLPFKLLRIKNYNYDMAIQKHEDGSFTILQLACTHTGHPLTKTGENYYCTMHGSRFSHEGMVLKGPAEMPLRQIKYVIDKSNLTFVLPA